MWVVIIFYSIPLFVVNAILPSSERYGISEEGFLAGFYRLILWLNFPVAVLSLLCNFIVLDIWLDKRKEEGHLRSFYGHKIWPVLTVLSSFLCLIVVFPGVLDDKNLQFDLVHLLPATGVLLSLIGFFSVFNLLSDPEKKTSSPFEKIVGSKQKANWPIGIGLVLALLLSLPWIFADLGIYIGDIPLLGKAWMSREPTPHREWLAAVHLGHHHGMDGLFLLFFALLIGKDLSDLALSSLRLSLSFCCALLVPYGFWALFSDFWEEQIWKRGVTDLCFDNALTPQVNLYWLGFLVVALLVHFFWFSQVKGKREAEKTGTLP